MEAMPQILLPVNSPFLSIEGCDRLAVNCWNQNQVWVEINDQLRQWVRMSEPHEASPSAAILDSQSVRTGGLIQDNIGFDGGKIIKGRKRHQLVDTLGWVVERTFGWMFWNRRLSKDYERLTPTSESLLNLASIKTMLNRFA
jgi:Transposase DDE domain